MELLMRHSLITELGEQHEGDFNADVPFPVNIPKAFLSNNGSNSNGSCGNSDSNRHQIPSHPRHRSSSIDPRMQSHGSPSAPADRWIETGLLGRALKPTSFIIRRSLDSKRPWKLLLSVCGWVDGRKSRTWLFHRHCHASMCTRLIYVDKSVLTGLPSVYNYRLWFMQVFQCLTDVSHYNQSAANGGNVELISPISPDPIMNTLSTVMFPVWRDQAVGTCAGPLFQDLPRVTES